MYENKLHEHYLHIEIFNARLRRGVTVFKVNMVPLRYLKTTDGLPDPKESLSSSIQPQAIARANEEVRVARYSGLINFRTHHTSCVRNFLTRKFFT